jgi:hypothetical protein
MPGYERAHLGTNLHTQLGRSETRPQPLAVKRMQTFSTFFSTFSHFFPLFSIIFHFFHLFQLFSTFSQLFSAAGQLQSSVPFSLSYFKSHDCIIVASVSTTPLRTSPPTDPGIYHSGCLYHQRPVLKHEFCPRPKFWSQGVNLAPSGEYSDPKA